MSSTFIESNKICAEKKPSDVNVNHCNGEGKKFEMVKKM
jgi:hypothetical protein